MGVDVCSYAVWEACVRAPFGVAKLEASDKALSRVMLQTDGCEFMEHDAPGWFIKLVEQMKRYFDGEKVDFGWVPVHFGSRIGVFRERVLMETRNIPYGQTVSYSELASAVGCSAAARAVGGAMAANPVPVVVPCHRVLRKLGSVGGFSAGKDIKLSLLRLEGVEV